MKGQIKMDLSSIKKETNVERYDKRRWRHEFQKYCDEMSDKYGSKNGYCVCGYMKYCDLCESAGKTNCCVKAICELAEQKNITLDIYDYDFEKIIEKVEEV